MQDITYDVRIYKTATYKGKRVTTYYVRWKVGRKPWKEPFRNKAQADSFRSALVTAARAGEAFDLDTGRPASWGRNEDTLTWYSFSLTYVDSKWPYASPGHRRCIAEALTDATEALYTTEKGAPSRSELRAALRLWAYSDRLTKQGEPPEELQPALRWLERNTVAMSDLLPDGTGPVRCRAVLDRLSRLQDGGQAAASTAIRKRMTFHNALEFACETGILPSNPLKRVKWTRPRTVQTLDMRTVVNTEQARRLLAAIKAEGERGERLVAFFATLYYAALRPEEAIDLRRENLISLPDDGWGEMRLTNAEPRSGRRWTDDGTPRQRRPLKHRAEGETRPVPIHPDLVRLLRHHLERWAQPGPQGRVFVGPRGGTVTDKVYLEIWHKARAAGLTEQEAASPLATTPYALRHAAVSTWLSAGVPAAQVAEWAGHSVAVLLKVYAKCISGQEQEAKRRITEATRLS